MENADPRHLLVNIVGILNKLRIPYLITGGMAVMVWGRPRFTADIDIIVQIQPKDINSLEKALKSISDAGYIDIDSMQRALKLFGQFNFIEGESGIKVDFYILKKTPYNLSQLKRKRIKTILGKNIYFSSPEDLILSKALWHKESYSDKQIEDIKSIIKISGEKLDYKYLDLWANKLDIEKILANLLTR